MRDKKQVGLTFHLETIAFLKGQKNKSAYVQNLIERDRQGMGVSDELSHLMQQYRRSFGQEPDRVICDGLRKKIDKMTSNLAGPLRKNQLGAAFQKLDRAFDQIKADNERQDDQAKKLAFTFGTLLDTGKCNHDAIRRWLRINRDKIEDYHRTVGIADPQRHNRQRGVLLRGLKGTEQAARS